MWLFTEELFNYLRERSTAKKLIDMFFIVTVFTWVAAVYVVASNFTTFKQIFATPVDVRSMIRLDKSINDILTGAMNKANSDRAALTRFHDSISDVQGRHFVYESRSNEVVQPGVAMVTQIRQNLLLSMMNEWAQHFVKDECVTLTDFTPLYQYYEFFHQVGVKSDIKCPVTNTEGVLVGYLGFEYTTKVLTQDELKEKEATARDAASKIGAILSVRPE